MRRVRSVGVTVLVAAGVLALAGCRSDPNVAAYVGSTRYTEDRVAAIADEAHTKLQEYVDDQQGQAGAGAEPVRRPVTEQQVVTALVSRDVLKALAEEKGVRPVDRDPNEIARQVQVPPEAEYVRVLVEQDGYRLGLLQDAASTRPSEAELREVYDNLVKTGDRLSYDQFRSELPDQNAELVGRSAAVRREISAAAQRLDVRVNPRYGPTMLSLIDVTDARTGTAHSLLGVSLNAQDSGVRDLS